MQKKIKTHDFSVAFDYGANFTRECFGLKGAILFFFDLLVYAVEGENFRLVIGGYSISFRGFSGTGRTAANGGVCMRVRS